jgi:hypothetical protein
MIILFMLNRILFLLLLVFLIMPGILLQGLRLLDRDDHHRGDRDDHHRGDRDDHHRGDWDDHHRGDWDDHHRGDRDDHRGRHL